ncbi:MAG: GxxExxY protein [Flavobacteriales bacterium]|nr:GxxExxY protein [Flavobacteriales bacterium]
MKHYSEQEFPLQKETDLIIGSGIEVHKRLGAGFLEIVYGDALELEFKERKTFYQREKEYPINYKGTILPHSYFADFVVFENIILEIKAKSGIANEDVAQTINYLKCSGCKVGLILNFGASIVGIKRVVL